MENRGRAQRRDGKKWKREKEIGQNKRERKKISLNRAGKK